jgi:serine/threonine-protein kinase
MSKEDKHPPDAGEAGSGKGPAQTPAGARSKDSDLRSTLDHSSESQQAVEGSIGAYQLVRRIGEGGMGTVHLAVRADKEFKKNVAIKVIRKGMDSQEIVARFRRERQILSSLDHPNIAKLLDGGTTEEGLPYFVMEHISGRPLTDYCDSHKLTTRERLELFRLVCSAVQYAHQSLVVHRDLKPANILVTADGIPKLLDFGIAKILNPDVFSGDLPPTATDIRVMTPEYASPEQARGDPVTTSSDIYSLGVILYELLVGRRPYHFTSRNQMEIFRVICEQEPTKPSTAVTEKQEKGTSPQQGTTPEKLRKELSGDLDNIILMALRKEPQRRYASIEALSEDLRRYMENQPVQARKGTWTYRSGKYIRRHKAGVATAAVILLLLVSFAVTVTLQNVRISQQRDAAEKAQAKAEAERQKALKVTDFLVKLFEVNDPSQSKGETLTARQILDRGAERLQKELKNQPDVQAELMDRVGVIYKKLGMYDQAESLLRQALSIRKAQFGGDHIAVAESQHDLGVVMLKMGQYDEAEKLLREALAMHRKLLGNEHPGVATDMSDLAIVLQDQGQLDEAEKLYREALAMHRKLLGNEPPDIATDLHNLADLLRDQGQLDEAEKLYREALDIDRKLLGNEHPDVASDLYSLASVLQYQGQLDEVEKLYREALAMHRKLLGNEHPDIATDLNGLASVLQYKGQLDEAEKLFREALAMHRKLLGNEHPHVASDLNSLASVLRDQGQLDEAEKLLREALAMRRKLLGNEHPYVAVSLAGLAEVLLSAGKAQDAYTLAEEALAFPEEELPADSKYRARAKSALGGILIVQKKYAEAEALLLDAYKIFSVQEKASVHAKRCLQRIIDLYRAWGKPEKAAEYQKLAQTQMAAK